MIKNARPLKAILVCSCFALALHLCPAAHGAGEEGWNLFGAKDQRPGQDFFAYTADKAKRVEAKKGKDSSGKESVNVYGDGKLIDSLDENAWDSKLKTYYWVDKKNVLLGVLYRDKHMHQVKINGYTTTIPYDTTWFECYDGDNADQIRLVWKTRSGRYYTAIVPTLTKMTGPPPRGARLQAKVVDDDLAERLGLPKGSGGTAPGFAGRQPDIGNGASHGSSRGGLKAPGNNYGADPILSDAEVRAIAGGEVARIRGAFSEPGRTMDDWGVIVGGGLSHRGGIDGFATAIHYWVANNSAVRSRLQTEANAKRARLQQAAAEAEAEAETRKESNTGGGADYESNEKPS